MTPRRCAEAGCDTILSRYNREAFCNAHTDAARRALAAEQAEAAAREQRLARAATGAAEGLTLRTRILDALPGTSADISARLGEPTRRVSRMLAMVVAAGQATAEGPRGSGSTDRRRIYRRVTQQEEAA